MQDEFGPEALLGNGGIVSDKPPTPAKRQPSGNRPQAPEIEQAPALRSLIGLMADRHAAAPG